MYNNPFNNFGYIPMQQQMQEPKQQQPIQNIFTNTTPTNNNDYYMAKILKSGETSASQIVTQKTFFLDLDNKRLDIKDVTGDVISYEIILPKDKKDIKIEELEKEIKELKEMMTNESTRNAESSKE